MVSGRKPCSQGQAGPLEGERPRAVAEVEDDAPLLGRPHLGEQPPPGVEEAVAGPAGRAGRGSGCPPGCSAASTSGRGRGWLPDVHRQGHPGGVPRRAGHLQGGAGVGAADPVPQAHLEPGDQVAVGRDSLDHLLHAGVGESRSSPTPWLTRPMLATCRKGITRVVADLDDEPAQPGEVVRPGAPQVDRGGHPGGETEGVRIDPDRRPAPVDVAVQVDQPGDDQGPGGVQDARPGRDGEPAAGAATRPASIKTSPTPSTPLAGSTTRPPETSRAEPRARAATSPAGRDSRPAGWRDSEPGRRRGITPAGRRSAPGVESRTRRRPCRRSATGPAATAR